MMEHERAVARFEREAQAMAAVDHPSVIAIHDRGRTARDEAFIVMEFVDGVQLGTLIDDLAERLEDGRPVESGVLSEQLGIDTQGEDNYLRVAVEWVADLAAAIHQTHAAGVVHRDIKPSNILIRRDGRPVLLDFGVALLEDAATFVYSLAAVLYCLISLRPPYKGTPTQVLASLATREPEPLEKLRRDVPRDLQAIVEQGMARRPGQRYADASALEADLRAFLEHRPIKARPTGPIRRLARRVRNSNAARGAAAALALAGLIAIAAIVRSDLLEAQGQRERDELAQREEQALELWRHFPPNFSIVNERNRWLTHSDDFDALRQMLDEAGDLVADPLPIVLLRATFRQDHGDLEGAVADMERIAAHEGTPLSQSMLASYRALTAEAHTSEDLDWSEWPEPDGVRDQYLLAYHGIRSRDFELVWPNLSEEVRGAIPHAEELHLAATVGTVGHPSVQERNRLASEFLERLTLLEDAYGRDTAATQNLRGAVCGIAGWYDRGFRASLRSVQLAPRSHINRTNAAGTAIHLGSYEAAREHALIGLKISPWDDKLAQHLVWSFIGERNFDEGLAVIPQFEEHLESIQPGYVATRLALLEIYRGLYMRTRARVDSEWDPSSLESEVQQCLARAESHVEEAIGRANANGAEGWDPTYYQGLIEALREDDAARLFETLAKEALENPRPWLFHRILNYFPDQFPDRVGPSTRALLEALVEQVQASEFGFAGK
jgi:serine/threonine-protein kinase